ncbi:iron ABC transporter permease [Natronolimnohabitans sp. A-GB9]|uniref:FecCD family ABC transporter permease n=1 Tax=Natronolimnohabitans sp. A-GB9 TaxID=3069757 RepID=UPI0027B57EBE|nr:iron ABC transporter permease [Natronolimnohabitans sp. A-GB9]MDQ2051993.1 iron ABC transporter permease [Natronolimnohabitans sp. A-GB9]
MASDSSRVDSVRTVVGLESIDSRLVPIVLGSLTVCLVMGVIQVTFGAYSMTVVTAWRAVFDPAVWGDPATLGRFLLGEGIASSLFGEATELSTETTIVWELRLPRALAAFIVGINLAISGAVFQAVTRNELASPFILGVSSGAGLAVILTLLFFGSLIYLLPIFAALGGAVAFLLVYAIAWNGGTSPVRLVLAGVIVGTVFSSLQTGLFFVADDLGVVQGALAWTTGSLVSVDWPQVRIGILVTAVTVVLTIAGARQLDVLLLGEETAHSLGMPVERIRFGLSCVAILSAGISVAIAGIVGFIGLIVPHVVRTIVGTAHARVVLGCLFVGPALLLAADVVARLAFSPVEVPVGIVTGLVGGPYFLYLMRKRRQLGNL